MSDKENKSADIFGLKAFGETTNILAKGVVDGAAAFLGRICLPAAEEFGLLLKDKIHMWRSKNFANILIKAEEMLEATGGVAGKHVHPRLVHSIYEGGSWIDDSDVQKMWAGFLASSCTRDGKDESNLIFINILNQITSVQARILNYACEKAEKYIDVVGLIYAKNLYVDVEELKAITGISDIQRLDLEMDHLRSLELIWAGFHQDSLTSDIRPTGLALNLYVRSQGSQQSPDTYFNLEKHKKP